MKILLISFNQQDVEEFKKAPTDISALGVRYLSSYLKNIGREVAILFLSKPHGETETSEELRQINRLIEDYQPDLVGLSLMSNHFFRAKDANQSIKKEFPDLPLIWGGIHPTIDSTKCLDFADMICVGEGELALQQLTEGDNLKRYTTLSIPGLWYKKDGQIVSGGKSVLVRDIDDLPFPDYDMANHYIMHEGKLLPMTENIFRQYYPAARGDHRLLSSRGCPHACAYCCNSVFRDIYSGVFLRRRAVGHLIEEMKAVKEKFSFVKAFKIMDDSFAVNDIEWMREFNRRYKEEINLPFFCLASPTTINSEKLELLVDAGLSTIQMGLQSGSDRVNSEVYLRQAKSNQFLTAMSLLEKYRGRLNVIIDVILDNPYENEEDLVQTIKVLNQIEKPFQLSLFSLTFYPGTELYRRAIADGHLTDGEQYLTKQFHRLNKNFLNQLIYLVPRLEKGQIDFLSRHRNNPAIRMVVRLMQSAYIKKDKSSSPLFGILRQIKKIVSSRNRPKNIKKFLYKIKQDLFMLYEYPKTDLAASPGMDYDSYWQKKRGVGKASLSASQKERAGLVLSMIEPGSSILDLGCGEGAVTQVFFESGKNLAVIGADISDLALEKAGALGLKTVKLDLNDLPSLANLPEVDYILGLEILEHLSCPEELIGIIKIKARKGLIFSIPNSGYYTSRLRLLFGSFPVQWLVHPSEHLRFWTVRDCRWWVNALGAKIDSLIVHLGVPGLNKIYPSLFGQGIIVKISFPAAPAGTALVEDYQAKQENND